MSYRFIDIVCTNTSCMFSLVDQNIAYGADYPLCDRCGAPTVRLWQMKSSAGVNSDECDIWATNVICNPDGTPRRYTSKAEMVREAAKQGMQPRVEHVPIPGSDKSPHTSRWV